MKRIFLFIVVLVMFFSFTGCGSSSGDNSSQTLTVEDYQQKIIDIKEQLEKDISKIESTFWGKSMDYYIFDLDDAYYLQFYNKGYGQSDVYSDPGVLLQSKEDSTIIYDTKDYNYKIDENNQATITIKHNHETSTYILTPNESQPRVEGTYQYIEDNEVGYFSTFYDGRALQIQELKEKANSLISEYENAIKILNSTPQTNNNDDTIPNSDNSTIKSVVRDGQTIYYTINVLQKYVGTYKNIGNKKSSMTLNSNGEGQFEIHKMRGGMPTNEIAEQGSLSWGIMVDKDTQEISNDRGHNAIVIITDHNADSISGNNPMDDSVSLLDGRDENGYIRVGYWIK